MNQLVPVQQTNAEVYRASTDAAGLCKEIVVNTAMEIQGRRYVKVEGWQALAIAHGCAASARDVEIVSGGVRAIGEVRRMTDGALIAQAEGFVGEDEPTWFGGTVEKEEWEGPKGQRRKTGRMISVTLPKRPDYAIRAMAQTRAVSRACRSAFAHVVVMMDAGLSTTPAEEVPDGGFRDDHVIDAEFTTVQDQPQRKSKKDARPEFEDLTKQMHGIKDEAILKAFGEKHAAIIKAWPADWQKDFRNSFGAKLNELKQRAKDPKGLVVDQPSNGVVADWAAYVEAVELLIQGATTPEELTDAQRLNTTGIGFANKMVEGAVERLAKAVEERAATLAANARAVETLAEEVFS